MARKVKFIIERHDNGYVGYPLGLKPGVSIVGQGDTYEQALNDVVSAVRFTLETMSEEEVFDPSYAAHEIFVTETEVPAGAEIPR